MRLTDPSISDKEGQRQIFISHSQLSAFQCFNKKLTAFIINWIQSLFDKNLVFCYSIGLRIKDYCPVRYFFAFCLTLHSLWSFSAFLFSLPFSSLFFFPPSLSLFLSSRLYHVPSFHSIRYFCSVSLYGWLNAGLLERCLSGFSETHNNKMYLNSFILPFDLFLTWQQKSCSFLNKNGKTKCPIFSHDFTSLSDRILQSKLVYLPISNE